MRLMLSGILLIRLTLIEHITTYTCHAACEGLIVCIWRGLKFSKPRQNITFAVKPKMLASQNHVESCLGKWKSCLHH